MKRIILFLIALAGFCATSFADNYQRAQSKNGGNYALTYKVTVSSSVPTVVVDSTLAIQAAYVDIFPNSVYTLWAGSNTATLQTTGFPILSSKTYTTDGVFTGNLYGLTDAAAAGSTDVRVIYYMKNDWAN